MIQSDLEAKRPSSNPSTQDGGGKGGGTIVPLRLGDETALLKNQPTNVERKERLDSTKSIPAGKLGAGDTTLHVGFLSKVKTRSSTVLSRPIRTNNNTNTGRSEFSIVGFPERGGYFPAVVSYARQKVTSWPAP
mmetsp:Transcript_28280/g.47930  ORF Transcript_28280/g.47930 Transcript_28280/m.47930 type:complete len:134 (-) Transcript_28280:1066-1467(-)